jgi:hypothetical protein
MSLLNLTNDGKRGVLVAIYRLLLGEKSMERERLLALCAPDGLSDKKHTRETLNTWVELGLFERSEDDRISIQPVMSSKERREELLPQFARQRVLAEENNRRFWEVEKSRSADFTRAVGWLLAQDVYEAEYASWDTVEAAIKRQTPQNESFFGKNDTRWNGLKAWAPFLGFAWTSKYPRSGALIVDPTDAFRDALPEIFGKRVTLATDEFLAALADALPVLDNGRYRRQVEDKLGEHKGVDAWIAPPDGQLSTSLSRALLRLLSEGTLRGEKRADAPKRARLTGRNRAVIDEYSHFSFKPTRASS